MTATTPKQEAVTAAVVASPDAWGIEFLGELLPELYRTEGAAQQVLSMRAMQYGDGKHRRMVPLFRAAASPIPRVADHLEDGGKAEADAKDAARYRWLRDKANRTQPRNWHRLHRSEILVICCSERGESDILHGDSLDAAIDTTLAPADPQRTAIGMRREGS